VKASRRVGLEPRAGPHFQPRVAKWHLALAVKITADFHPRRRYCGFYADLCPKHYLVSHLPACLLFGLGGGKWNKIGGKHEASKIPPI
jgi:hypothetical protein